MAATSLKLSDELKRRIERLAAGEHKSTHAYMVDVLAREVERSELRARFAEEAATSEADTLAGGKTYDLAQAFDYLEGRLAGRKARRPKGRAWRVSK